LQTTDEPWAFLCDLRRAASIRCFYSLPDISSFLPGMVRKGYETPS